MVCFRPIDVWPAAPPEKGFVFSGTRSYSGAKATSIPCGKCMGCRITRQDEWRSRLILEGKMHECSSFVTLTYAPENLPEDYSLSKRHLQTWLKRLRFVLDPLRIRFFACGEYGTKNLRPHYHAIIFGYDFPDRTYFAQGVNGEVRYRSELLERTWTLGYSELGSFTPQSAGYVAGYSLKKITGEAAEKHYERMNPETGQIHQVLPEFILMSSRPGIGLPWYSKHGRDAFPSDFLIIDGCRKPVPRYFKRKFDDTGDLNVLRVNAARKAAGRKPSRDKTWERRKGREEVAEYRAKQRQDKELD